MSYYKVTTCRNERRFPSATEFKVWAVKSEKEAIEKLCWLFKNGITVTNRRKLMRHEVPETTLIELILTLNNKVREAIINASENGYSFKNMSVREIATDMLTYDSALENEPFLDIMTTIQIILNETN